MPNGQAAYIITLLAMVNRLKQLKKVLRDKGLDGLIVTNPFNIFYLCGFRGVSPLEREAFLVFNPSATLIIPRLYQNEAKGLKSIDLKIAIADERHKMHQLVAKLLKGVGRIGLEEHDLKYSEFTLFKKSLKDSTLVSTKHLIEDLRAIKSDEEIRRIEKAQIISQKAFIQLIKTIKPGQTEAEISERLSRIIKNLGGQGFSFEAIVASGKNSAKPHHITSNRRLTINDILLLDFGAKYRDYCADLTRTVFVGRAHNQHRNIYHHVQTAQKQAIEQIKHGIKSEEVFAAANNHFKKHRFNKFFLHSLGHGIGLEVHEKPHLRAKSQTRFGIGRQTGFDDYEVLQEGMVFSIEPGLYFPSWGGVRIEDLVTIKNGRAKVLGKTSQLIELV